MTLKEFLLSDPWEAWLPRDPFIVELEQHAQTGATQAYLRRMTNAETN